MRERRLSPKQEAEKRARERALAELLGMLRRARDRGEEWYRWVESGRPAYTTEQYRASSAGAQAGRR